MTISLMKLAYSAAAKSQESALYMVYPPLGGRDQCRCFLWLAKKTPAAKTNSGRVLRSTIKLKARDDSFSIRVVSSTVCKTIFSSSTRIENVSATTPLRFTPQRRRRRRRPAVVGGQFEGVAEPE